AWQRLIILLAGVTMNVLLAFVIYAMILFTWGTTKIPNESLKNGIWVTDSLMSKNGLENGDKIEAINGEPVKYFEDVPAKILLGKQITVERNGREQTINIPVNLIEQLVEKKSKRGASLVEVRMPVIIGAFPSTDEEGSPSLNKSVSVDTRTNVMKGKGAKAASENLNSKRLRLFDKIVAVDSTPVNYFDEMAPLLKQKKGDSITLTVIRNQQPVQARVLVDSAGAIGFYNINSLQADSLGLLKLETKKYGFLESFPAGVRETGKQLNFYIQQFKMILNPETG